MKRYIIITVSAFTLMGCKKEKVETTSSLTEDKQSYKVPSKVGSYWIYNRYEIDSLGIETQMTNADSVFITGDTLINNHLFTRFKGTNFGFPFTSYERDSLGYIVDQYGTIIYSYTDFNSTIGTGNNTTYQYRYQMEDLTTTEITVPAGTFNTIEKQFFISRIDGNSISNCAGNIIMHPTNYASGIGKIKSTKSFITAFPDCKYKEQRLVEYYIP